MRALSFLVLAISLLVPARLSARMETAYSPDNNIVVNYSSRYGDVKYSIEKWEAKTDIFTSKIGK